MRITIVAATGGIGRKAVHLASAAGHEVTAVARNPRDLPADVRVMTTDFSAPDPAALDCAVGRADAVLSALGPRSLSDAGIASRGTRAIVDAMNARGVRRIIVVSAAPLSTIPSPARPDAPRHDPGEGFFMRHLLGPLTKAVLRRHYADLALMEDMLWSSGLEWTIVRPPRLTNRPLTGRYRVAYGQNLRRGLFVSRADVAHFMLRALEDPASVHQAVGIAN
jgi:putative NADH-flavin reductase